MHFYWSTTYKKSSLEMTSSFPKGLKSMILFLRAFFSFCKFHFSNLLQTQFFNQKKSDFGSLQERMFTQDQLHFRHDFSKVSGFLWTSYKQILIYLSTPQLPRIELLDKQKWNFPLSNKKSKIDYASFEFFWCM